MLILPEVRHRQALAPVFAGQCDMLANVVCFTTVLGNEDLEACIYAGCLSAIAEAFAHLVEAFQAGAQVGGAVGDRDAENEVVAFVSGSRRLRLLPDQRLLFAEQRLVAVQQCIKIRP